MQPFFIGSSTVSPRWTVQMRSPQQMATSIYGSRRALASRNTNIYTPRPSMKHVTLDATPDSLSQKPATSNHRKRTFEELGPDPEVPRAARYFGARRDDGLAVNSWLGEEGEGVQLEEEVCS